MAELGFHPEAIAELEEAADWYQARSPAAATGFAEELERTLEAVTASPTTFAKYDEEHRFAVLRRYPYSVVFALQGDRVLVVAIAHSSREPGYWQHRRP